VYSTIRCTVLKHDIKRYGEGSPAAVAGGCVGEVCRGADRREPEVRRSHICMCMHVCNYVQSTKGSMLLIIRLNFCHRSMR